MTESSVSIKNKEFIKKNKRNRDKSKDYVDNAQFLLAIIDYQKSVRKAKREKREKPRLTNYLGECIYKIADNMTKNKLFYKYSFKDEMSSDAIENCIQYFDNFDPKKYSNPFGYFTQIIAHAFIRRINKEEKQRYAMYKQFSETFDPQEVNEFFGDQHLQSKEFYDNINSFMKHFEQKERDKKEKQILNAALKEKAKKRKVA